ncbi:MAG: Bax inhibitor-1/YccA family protein [Sphingomonadaceae bacterium]|nr:Bax inhibitor-1/YccA family protein [Sphingomonadaceae bacterium]
MANQFDPRAAARGFAGPVAQTATFDAGLRRYMLSVYNYMASGVLLTGIVALFFAQTGAVNALFNEVGRPSLLGWIAMLAPLGIVLAMSAGVNRMSEASLKALFWGYAAIMGVSLSTIFLRYTGASIAATFFATAASFGALSLYGYTTKRDLSGIGKFLLMGLVGLIVASLINAFFPSAGVSLAISMVGVLLFAALTVYDTQKIKAMYDYVGGTDFAGKSVVMGALTLYLDFINLFLFLLRFMGGNRN